MKFLTLLAVLGCCCGTYYFTTQDAPTDTIPKVRIVAGKAKFVSANPEAVLDRGGRATGSPFVVNLMNRQSPTTPPKRRLSLSALQARQQAQRDGIVTQRNGSGSLALHNDVRRMDGKIWP